MSQPQYKKDKQLYAICKYKVESLYLAYFEKIYSGTMDQCLDYANINDIILRDFHKELDQVTLEMWGVNKDELAKVMYIMPDFTLGDIDINKLSREAFDRRSIASKS
jgi:hypothetical protein